MVADLRIYYRKETFKLLLNVLSSQYIVISCGVCHKPYVKSLF